MPDIECSLLSDSRKLVNPAESGENKTEAEQRRNRSCYDSIAYRIRQYLKLP